MPPAINREPVPFEELNSFEEFGKPFFAPDDCMNCPSLTKKTVAKVLGLTILDTPTGERLLVPCQQSKIEAELASRCLQAANGKCHFIEEQNCWRVKQ